MDKIYPGGVDFSKNPELQGKTAGKVLDFIILQLREKGILVLLDLHVTKAGGQINELWYDQDYPEAKIIQVWQNIVKRYQDLQAWNVVACDLNNEPHGEASWGSGDEADWRIGAEKLACSIHEINPKLLIFVEGVEKNVCVKVSRGSWWGGCLAGVKEQNVRLNIKDKLVYSPHCYGPDVSMQPYFNCDDFSALPQIWGEDFGFIKSQAMGPAICLGEFGGKGLEGSLDRKWQEAFVDWLIKKDLRNNFYWCLNPNSGDTQGLLADDWSSQNIWKLNLLNKLQPNPSKIDIQLNGKVSCSQDQNIFQIKPSEERNLQESQNDQVNQVSRDFDQVQLGSQGDRGFWSSVKFEKKVKNSWQSNGVTSYDVDIQVVNDTQHDVRDIEIEICPIENIQQVWCLDLLKQEHDYSIYHLPSWLVNNGGLKAREKHSFGGIFIKEIPIISVHEQKQVSSQTFQQPLNHQDQINQNQYLNNQQTQNGNNQNTIIPPPNLQYNMQPQQYQAQNYNQQSLMTNQQTEVYSNNQQQQQNDILGPVYIPNSSQNEYHNPQNYQPNNYPSTEYQSFGQGQGDQYGQGQGQDQGQYQGQIQSQGQENYPSICENQGHQTSYEDYQEIYQQNQQSGLKHGKMYEQDSHTLV